MITSSVLAAQDEADRFGHGFLHGLRAIFWGIVNAFPHHLDNAYQAGHLVGVLVFIVVVAIAVARYT